MEKKGVVLRDHKSILKLEKKLVINGVHWMKHTVRRASFFVSDYMYAIFFCKKS